MTGIVHRLLDWVGRAEVRERERYLAQSADASDLERRMREWERAHGGRVYLQ